MVALDPAFDAAKYSPSRRSPRIWREYGESRAFIPNRTRIGMLALASFGALAAFLLAIELTRETRGAPAFLAAGLLCVSPLFYAQSMLAQLDAPAMLFHHAGAAPVSPGPLPRRGGGLRRPGPGERNRRGRSRRAGDLAGARTALAGCGLVRRAAFVLGAWIAILARQTGYWAGNPDFARYNLRDPLHPVRLLVTLARGGFSF